MRRFLTTFASCFARDTTLFAQIPSRITTSNRKEGAKRPNQIWSALIRV